MGAEFTTVSPSPASSMGGGGGADIHSWKVVPDFPSSRGRSRTSAYAIPAIRRSVENAVTQSFNERPPFVRS
jgi:hypothetical protein